MGEARELGLVDLDRRPRAIDELTDVHGKVRYWETLRDLMPEIANGRSLGSSQWAEVVILGPVIRVLEKRSLVQEAAILPANRNAQAGSALMPQRDELSNDCAFRVNPNSGSGRKRRGFRRNPNRQSG